jgi:hypothetical protein
MLVFTAPDGSEARIDGSRVIRIRATYNNESNLRASTRIDWVNFVFVKEDAGVVVQKVKTEHHHIAQLMAPNGAPIWFDATKADGPVRTTRFERHDGVQSAMNLAGKKQYLSSTPAEVSAAIRAAGGTPLPIPTEGFLEAIAGFFNQLRRGTQSENDAWD